MWSKLIILLDPVTYRLLDGRDRKEVDVKGLEAFLFQVCIERLATNHSRIRWEIGSREEWEFMKRYNVARDNEKAPQIRETEVPQDRRHFRLGKNQEPFLNRVLLSL